MSLSKVYVVVPSLNGEDYIGNCIDSLLAQTVDAQVIVVENGSTDDSVGLLKSYGSKIKLIIKKHNSGFTGGVNTGIEHALSHQAEAIALLNNDAVVELDWLEKLLKRMQGNSRCGIVASKILLEKSECLDSTGETMTTWGVPFPRGRREIDKGQYDQKTDVFGASGGASLYRAEMLKQIGLFDDDYFAYLEDVDISFRAQAAGWEVKYEPEAVVYHKLSATSSKLGKDFVFYHFVKNFMLLYARNMPLWLYLKYLPLFCIHLLRLGVGSLLRRQLGTFVKAVWSAVKLHPKTVKKRRERNQLRQLSAAEIDAKLYHGLPPRPPALRKDD